MPKIVVVADNRFGKSCIKPSALADERLKAIAFGKAAPGKSYPTAFIIGKINGVEGFYRSTDEGKTWVQINDAKTGFGTGERIEGDPRIFGRVYIGTNGRGVIYGDIKK